MKTRILFPIVLLITLMGQAQTKVIAHKSHSGSNNSFSIRYHKNIFDTNSSNFGLPGNRNIVILDSIIAIGKSVTILKIRESIVCYRYGTDYKELKKSDFKVRIDTLVNDPIFNKKHTVAHIKTIFLYKRNFSNPIDSIVFIGFKNK